MVSAGQRIVRLFTKLMERGFLPDRVIRWGIRHLLSCRARSFERLGPSCRLAANQRFLKRMREAPVALVPAKANEQHYEVPAAFFEQVLGPRRKYSCCCYPAGVDSLATAEETALALTCERANIRDGMKLLELGCGWGSLTLYMAQHYPNAAVTAVSNSQSQREFIETACAARGLHNVRVITHDMNGFVPPETDFDRVVSVEMFEHMRNWPELLRRIASWLKPDGRLFVHVFCHRECVYEFETRAESDWMGREFFSGGIMPSDDLMLHCQDDLALVEQWRIDGMHYHKTCEAWLANLDTRRAAVRPIFTSVYGEDQAECWIQRWRVFFMACSELFGYRRGCEWWVAHYLLRPRPRPEGPTE